MSGYGSFSQGWATFKNIHQDFHRTSNRIMHRFISGDMNNEFYRDSCRITNTTLEIGSSLDSTAASFLNLAFQDTFIYHNDDPIRTHLSYQTTINLRTPTENYMQTIFPVDRSNPYYQSSMFLTELTTDSLLFSSLAKGLKSPNYLKTLQSEANFAQIAAKETFNIGKLLEAEKTFVNRGTSFTGTKGIEQSIIGKLETFLGKDSKFFKNTYEDLLIESKDGLRQFRMDLNHPKPHENPHAHLIEYEIRKNKKFEIINERIYPIDVKPE